MAFGSAIPILKGRFVLWRDEARCFESPWPQPDSILEERKHLPFALGSCTLNRLAILVEILGAPVLRFMLNLRLANDILPAFALFSSMSVGVRPHRCLKSQETEGLWSENQKSEEGEQPGLNVEGRGVAERRGASAVLCYAPLNASLSGEEATSLSITTGAPHSSLRKSKFPVRCMQLSE